MRLQYKKRKSKNKTKTHVYVVKNYVVTCPDTGDKKSKRKYITTLGVLGETISSKRHATQLYNEWLQGLTCASDPASKITFESLLNDFQAYLKTQVDIGSLSLSTYKLFVSQRKHLIDLEHLNLNRVGFLEFEQLKHNLSGKMKNRSINILLFQIQKAYKFAFKNKVKYRLTEMPIIDKLPNDSTPREKVPPEHLSRMLTNKSNKSLWEYLVVLTYTGIRPQEYVHLKGKHLIFKDTGGIIDVPEIKTHARSLPMNSKLFKLLKNRNFQDDELICPYSSTSSARRAMKQLCKELSIPCYTPYNLRHTFASMLAEKRVPLVEVQRLLGHSDPKTSERNYIHMKAEELRNAIDVL